MQPSYGSIEDGTEVKPRESMKLCVAILKLGGLFRTKDMSQRDSILYSVLQALVLLLFCSITFSLYVYLFVTWGSFSDMIETISYTITMTVFALKMNVFMLRGDEVQLIVKMIQDNFFIHGTELSTENRKIIKHTMKLARKVTVAYATLQMTVGAVFIFGPLTSFDVVLQTHNTTNKSSESLVYDRNLPIQLWIPLDITRSPQFEIAYTYVALAGFANSANMVGIEIFCMTNFIYLTSQFELLCDSIRNASEKVKYRLHKRQHSAAGSLEFTSDKKTKIQYPRANTDSVSSAKGKGNIIYEKQKSSLKHAPIHILFSDFLPMYLLVYLHTTFRSDVLIFFLQVFVQFRGVGIPRECLS